MTIDGLKIKHPKIRGEWAELRFMARAAEQGFAVNKPWGESCHYDFVVQFNKCLLRVQVKSTMYREGSNYCCILRRPGARYQKDDFDFLAIYVIPRDLWYIVPVAVALAKGQRIYLNPDSDGSIYASYREAWSQLKEKLCINHANADLCFRHGCPTRVECEPDLAPDADINLNPTI